ncbi:hypothetical protein ES332_A11G260900v1 [Gossypium tomentosum]|uniref:Transcription factor MYB60 n=1 Tax=Gossypium tomentosum TaxID=34277 RepID=A0A5D2NE44_GOSTO|nr:hypothetical protein ES332_A11G260900v1 [Gossypium tomentosum]
MGRPPSCDKVGIKKGPWTPEEDIILVSYIQQHGPGNWRSVPTNTGLLRCSKSCRLRWTNYLRPGIKRGNFTPHEEGMIIHLQALLGNKWAAIASYLPQRTDNDIKNYWNTHLKKKLNKFQSALDPHPSIERKSSLEFASTSSSTSALGLNQVSSTYASSTENISRLLQGWMRSSPKITNDNNSSLPLKDTSQYQKWDQNTSLDADSSAGYKPKAEQEGGNLISHEEFKSILSFENINNVVWDKSTCESTSKGACQDSGNDDDGDDDDDDDGGGGGGGDKVNVAMAPENYKKQKVDHHNNNNNKNNPPLSFLEKWLFDESSSGQVEEMNQMMELSSVF